MPSWLAGVAMSTTSVAVVYAVMLEFGFNAIDYGKVVLAACFITDLGTVLALGLIFAPFTFKTAGVHHHMWRNFGIPAMDHRSVLSAIRWPSIRTRDQIPAPASVRARRACDVGRQRSRSARLPDRHDLGRKRRQGSYSDPQAAHAVLRLPYAFLLHPRWFVRLGACADRGTGCVSDYAGHQADHQDRWRLSGHPLLRLTA